MRNYHPIDSTPDTLFGVRKEKPNEGSTLNRRSITVCVNMNKQAVLLVAAARTVEVARLERDLKQAEEELSLMKRQLEESQGK